ncbi:TPA_asm: cell division protein FtsQ/DivIB [Listeria innocua]|uniref:cell division protein FtsQ/DivIB n=1 Tax=Listeria innocua TaxID=1642 RepID=UPI000F9B5D14|nr:cell division protein FtsQ/DivIB [Listeria innocua]QPQ95416.1 cell division protein FtsQ/DivIB [Listeria welshimeri]EAD5840928.1 cell division protein FtsQ/DivIB [Listeria innocua]EAG8542038.1 cell division protein FtsQ/DivIB [Listeria innocua]ECL7895361.1 cell division protein FtsQ/DivIB [Listeria innocua]ECL8006540.1 cell division protein FtsQ/DivIB [Listeria innocua]
MAENKRVVSIENRIPELKKYRKKKLIRHLAILIGIFAILILITLYFLSPLSKLDKIAVSGNKQLTENEVRKESGLTSGEFVLGISNGKTEDKLEKNTLIKNATVSKDGLNDVKINITEYKTIGYQQNDGKYYDVLENGTMLTDQPRQFPIGNDLLFQNFKNGKTLEKMVAQINKLPKDVVNSISEVIYSPTKTDQNHIELYMNDGNQVSADISSFADKMQHYPAIVAQLAKGQKGVIDIEVGSYFQSYYQQNAEKKAAEEKAAEKKKENE